MFNKPLFKAFINIAKQTCRKNNSRTDYEEYVDSQKSKADRFAEAMLKIRNETDPLKREKMNARLAYGITDFSDL